MSNLLLRPLGSVREGETVTDAELLALWSAESDTHALEVLVRRHGAMVLGVCLRVLGNRADADDACQAAFLVFIQKAHTLTHPEQVAAWLHAVALRVARKAKSKRLRQHGRETALVDNVDPVDPVNPNLVTEMRELRRSLDEELDRLPEKYRLPIVLCELEGRTLEEAALLLGWPKGTVAGRLSRGRELLRKRLSRRGIVLPLFLMVPLPGLGGMDAPEPLVSATMASAAGRPPAAPPAELAQSFMRAQLRRRLGLLAVALIAAAILALLGWQTWPGEVNAAPAQAAPAQCPSHP